MKPIRLLCAVFVAVSLAPAPAPAAIHLPNRDGYWATPVLPVQWDHAAVAIPDRDLLVVLAEGTPRSSGLEVWATALGDGEAWVRVATGGPVLGSGFVAVYDPVGRQVLVQGGRTNVAGTWALRLEPQVTWSEFLPAADGPGARWDHVAIYDPRHERVILHGGQGAAGPLADLWELRLRGARPGWTLLRSRGHAPGPLVGHAAAYDEAGLRMIVFGGEPSSASSDAWELSLRGNPVWRRLLLADGPGAGRAQHTLVIDPAGNRVLLHGGVASPADGGATQTDTWELGLGATPAWNRLSPSGAAAPPRARHVAVFDPARARMIVSGGAPAAAPQPPNSTGALDFASGPRWSRLAPTPDLPAHASIAATWLAAAMDEPRRRLFVLTNGTSADALGQGWFLDFAPNPRWSRSFDPPARNTDVVYDPDRDRLLIHAGFISPSGRTNQTWELGLAPNAPLGWRELATGGLGPPIARMDHVLIRDSRRNALAVFGGSAQLAPCTITTDAATLALSATPASWSPTTGPGQPEGGWFPVGIYDPVGDRLVVHGGQFACLYPGGHPSGATYDGTWAYDLQNPQGWTRLSDPSLGPGSVRGAAYDPIARSLVAAGPGTSAWVMPLDPGSESWRWLDVRGIAPIVTNPSTFDYDAGRDRFVVVTSAGQVRYLLPVRDELPDPVVPPLPRSAPTALAVPPTAGAAFGLEVGANPARGALRLAVRLGAGPAGLLTLHDARGRLVRSEEIPAGRSGPVTLTLPGNAPGVYFARLRQGSNVEVRRVVFVD